MSRFIDCWNYCEPTLQNRNDKNQFAEVTFHVTKMSFVAMRRQRMLNSILAGVGRGLSPLSLIFPPPERPLLAGKSLAKDLGRMYTAEPCRFKLGSH